MSKSPRGGQRTHSIRERLSVDRKQRLCAGTAMCDLPSFPVPYSHVSPLRKQKGGPVARFLSVFLAFNEVMAWFLKSWYRG